MLHVVSRDTNRYQHYAFAIAMVADGWSTPDCYSNDFEPLPNSAGVYLIAVTKAFWRDKTEYPRVAYAGKSRNLCRRLINHPVHIQIMANAHRMQADDGTNYTVQRWFKCLPEADIGRAEIALIEQHDPPYNLQHRVRRL